MKRTEGGPCPHGGDGLVGKMHYMFASCKQLTKQLSASIQDAVKADSWVLWETPIVISYSLGCSRGQGSVCKVLSMWSGLNKLLL